MNLRLRPAAAALVLSATALLTACSGSVTVGDSAEAVTTAELEKAIAERITVDGGGDGGITITCADELPAKVDASVDCFGTDPDGARTGFRPTVTAVDGDEIEYTAPIFVPADELTAQLRTQLEEVEGNVLTSLECDEAAGEPGATATCLGQVEGAEEQELLVTIEEIDGLRFRFTYELAPA